MRQTTPLRLFRVGNRRKTTLKPTTRQSTTSTFNSPKPTSNLPRRKFPLQNKKVVESQVIPSTSPRVTINFRGGSRKPLFRTTTPNRKLVTTSEPVDQHLESSNQQSLEDEFPDDIDTTELTDIALALHDIQQAPIPVPINKKTPTTALVPKTTSTTTTQRILPVRVSTRSKVRYTTTISPLTLTTRKFVVRNRRPQVFEKITAKVNVFEKINPSVENHFKDSSEYDYYDDGIGILGRIPEHSKVLLHSNGVIECLDQGNFPHPVSCKKFISCAKMENGKVLGWEYTCPKNLSFDPIGGICNWSAGLGCSEQ